MKYFAIIEGEQRGPFELDQLAAAGVRPSTYVWCKGMADWEKAEDVADICRMYRGRLYDLLHPKVEIPARREPEPQNLTPENAGSPTRFDRMLGGEALPTLEEIDAMQDIARKPQNMLPLAILATILFFPPLGLFAIYFAVASRRCWRRSLEAASNPGENVSGEGDMKEPATYNDSVKDWQRLAHEYCRAAKMWTGITFFIGLIFYGFLFSTFL